MATLANSTITAVNTLGTSPSPVIGANPARTGITFHAPGAIDMYVAPTQVLSGGQRVIPSLQQQRNEAMDRAAIAEARAAQLAEEVQRLKSELEKAKTEKSKE